MKKQEENATEQDNGIYGVATRKGAKGPGSIVAHIIGQKDATAVAAELQKTAEAGVLMIVRPITPIVAKTAEQWGTENKEAQAKIARRQELLSQMSDADKAALGVDG